MRYKAIKYGEYFQGKISICQQKRGIIVNFEDCIDPDIQKWRVRIESNVVMNPGEVFELEKGVLCEIVNRSSSKHFVRFLMPQSECSNDWIKNNIA
jgi:hypothetical protein